MRLLLLVLVLIFGRSLEGVAAKAEQALVSLQRPHHGVSFHVDVARTPHDLAHGLMDRTSLPKEGGMLFLFPTPQKVAFWMKNTRISLDIIFIQEDGTVVQLYEKTQPLTLDRLDSKMPVKYVLELPGGSVQNHAIYLGDRLYLK